MLSRRVYSLVCLWPRKYSSLKNIVKISRFQEIMSKRFFFSFLFLFFFYFPAGAKELFNSSSPELSQAEDIWKRLPIQHQGRIKPFDTFSREILRKVYGRESYNSRSAVEVILSWLIAPDFWENTKFILIEEKDIKGFLDLPVKSKRFSPSELSGNHKLALQLTELDSLRQRKEPLDPYFRNLEKLETRLILYTAVKTGHLIQIEPQDSGLAWLALPEMSQPAERQFKKALAGYARLISSSVSWPSSIDKKLTEEGLGRLQPRGEDLSVSDKGASTGKLKPQILKNPDGGEKNPLEAGDSAQSFWLADFKKEMRNFQNLTRAEEAFHPLKLKAEVFYNGFKPFQKAWICYFLFLMALMGLYIFKRADYFFWIMPLAGLGFASHSLGLLLRSYIMSRPPVSNMYETVVWVPWAALLAGFVFYLKGAKAPFSASALLAGFCLLLTSLAPEILDASLQPLEAVLNSSFWLATHVLVITMSYSFFFLAFVLGDMALISFLARSSQPLKMAEQTFHPIYRSIQWGVVFLAGGVILGGIWADYSWGRFWGWDPKESWALISLLAYLALLHARLAQWIKAFGLAVGAVMMFFSVIMAWYGVNFILGAGLHSYGFGSGGVEYVLGFLIAHLLLCGLAGVKKIRLDK